MKKVFNAIKSAWLFYKNPHLFQQDMFKILEGQFRFLNDTAKENRPMVTNIAHIYWEDKQKKELKLLSLWCGIGDSSPIERCRQLASENTKLTLSNANLLQEIQELKLKLKNPK